MDVNSILLNLRSFASEVVNRRIITVVGAPTVTGPIDKLEIAYAADTAPATIVTNINMLQADVTTSVHPDIATGKYPDAKALHDRMVDLSTDVLERNAAILKELASWLMDQREPSDN